MDKVRALRQDASGGPGTAEVGAITFPKQLETIERHVRDAVDKGARILTGGRRREGEGDFYEPTVLVDVDHTMDCMREETFGPTLPIMKVADADEAVRLANDTVYGLGATVCTKDVKRGKEIAGRMHAGTVSVNDIFAHYFALGLPMGGLKSSGVGFGRHGADGIRMFCERQGILAARWNLNRDLHWYPFNARQSTALLRSVRLLYGSGRRK